MCKLAQGQIVDGAQNHAFLAASHCIFVAWDLGFTGLIFYRGIKRTSDGGRIFIAFRQSSLERSHAGNFDQRQDTAWEMMLDGFT